MTEFDHETIDPSTVPEVQDLERLHTQVDRLAESLRLGEFSSEEEKIAAQCEFVARVKEATTLGTDEEVHDLVGYAGSRAVSELFRIRIASTFDEDNEELKIGESVARVTIEDAASLVARYGVQTEGTLEFERQLASIFKRHIEEPADPYAEFLERHEVSITAGQHYIAGEDNNLTRIVDDLTETNSQEEDARRRALFAVVNSTDGLTQRQLFDHVYGAGESYAAKKIQPITDWLMSIPMYDQKLMVAYPWSKDPSAKKKESKINVAPNLEVQIEEADVNHEKSTEIDRKKAKRQLQDICVIANYLHGLNEVLEAYGHDSISDDMLESLVPYIPRVRFGSGRTNDDIELVRKLALKDTLKATSNLDSLLELIYNINELSRKDEVTTDTEEAKVLTEQEMLESTQTHEEAMQEEAAAIKAAKAASKFLKILEKYQGRELLAVLANAKPKVKTGLVNGINVVIERKVFNDADREIYPTLVEDLVYSKE